MARVDKQQARKVQTDRIVHPQERNYGMGSRRATRAPVATRIFTSPVKPRISLKLGSGPSPECPEAREALNSTQARFRPQAREALNFHKPCEALTAYHSRCSRPSLPITIKDTRAWNKHSMVNKLTVQIQSEERMGTDRYST